MGEVSQKFRGVLEADKSSALRHNLCKVKHEGHLETWPHLRGHIVKTNDHSSFQARIQAHILRKYENSLK